MRSYEHPQVRWDFPLSGRATSREISKIQKIQIQFKTPEFELWGKFGKSLGSAASCLSKSEKKSEENLFLDFFQVPPLVVLFSCCCGVSSALPPLLSPSLRCAFLLLCKSDIDFTFKHTPDLF